MKKLTVICTFAILSPLAALGQVNAQTGAVYIGNTKVDTGNLNIDVRSFRQDIPYVEVRNNSAVAVICHANFSNVPQYSETKFARVASGKRATLAEPMHYTTARVDIDVRCEPSQQG